jgi:hypothetical protein
MEVEVAVVVVQMDLQPPVQVAPEAEEMPEAEQTIMEIRELTVLAAAVAEDRNSLDPAPAAAQEGLGLSYFQFQPQYTPGQLLEVRPLQLRALTQL